jgi:hypothetical protein
MDFGTTLEQGDFAAWACGTMYGLGQLTFLSDPASQPHITLAEIAARFGNATGARVYPGRSIR